MGDHLEWTSKHPVSSVRWVPADQVYANDYNPNKVAPPEMRLLELSISADGFTQPIVTWQTEQGYEVIDGFHRHIVGKKLKLSHLPIVVINRDRTDKGDRIAATIRHNRARGKHTVDGMSDIVLDLSRRNWSDKKISKELGMDPDEVLRLKQITGLAEMFADREFSDAWEVEM
jgi:ParB-like chromosome segregation protein Spo0J